MTKNAKIKIFHGKSDIFGRFFKHCGKTLFKKRSKKVDTTHFPRDSFNYASLRFAYTLRKLRNIRIIHHMHISHLEQPRKKKDFLDAKSTFLD